MKTIVSYFTQKTVCLLQMSQKPVKTVFWEYLEQLTRKEKNKDKAYLTGTIPYTFS